jgi:hypothetical protein
MTIEPERSATLESLLHAAGVGWLLQEAKDTRLTQILNEMDELSTYLRDRQLSQTPDLLQEAATEPTELRPLVQLFASPTSTTIRAMAYCVLRGADIQSVSFEYRLEQVAKLRIELSHPHARGSTIEFESDNLWDAEVLRHVGMMKRGGRPVLHGYYAFAD